MKIEFLDDEVNERVVKGHDGKVHTFRTQRAYIQLDGKPYPVEINIQLWDKAPYKPGFYDLGDKSFKVDKYRNLVLASSLDLVKTP